MTNQIRVDWYTKSRPKVGLTVHVDCGKYSAEEMYPVSGASKDYYTLLVVPPGRRSLFYRIDGSDVNTQHLDSVRDSKLVCSTGMLNVYDVARRIETSCSKFRVAPNPKP